MNRAISPTKRASISLALTFLLPSLALAEEVSVGMPIAKGTPGDRNGYVNGTGYQPYQPPQVNSDARPQGGQSNAQPQNDNAQSAPMPSLAMANAAARVDAHLDTIERDVESWIRSQGM